MCFSPCWFMCLWWPTSPTVLWLLVYGSSRSEWGYPTIFLQSAGPSSRTYSVTRSMQEFPQRDDSVFPHCRWDSTIFSNLVVINLVRGYQAIVFGDLYIAMRRLQMFLSQGSPLWHCYYNHKGKSMVWKWPHLKWKQKRESLLSDGKRCVSTNLRS